MALDCLVSTIRHYGIDMDDCVIYDFETLGQDQTKSAVVSFAMITFSERHYSSDPYEFDELINKANFIKFDVKDQINNYGRKINKETLDWWNQQGVAAKKQLNPSSNDRKISELYSFIKDNIQGMSIKKTYTRGNTFDPMFLTSLMRDTSNEEPFHWRTIRDTRSMIDGMAFGMKLNNNFMPDGYGEQFIAHDPRHDCALDIIRMQMLAQSIVQ